ncbi:Ribosome production factor 1 [Colletotrichum orbiculare MAFF 240422]|uniref:Ribosome production factor 1 n=1 Tax=Colletotrichum orbiculare (strain 104-T / ATCC 96160 / CBS 514.97 / LARS 414 / MAFF 240422) TaxID=1213857 RepID=N4UYZ2_COLOR|nr:Ribosome production factor 1 [Colletotrichum orbiculare MAFF 240422]
MGFSKPGKSIGASLSTKTSNKLKRKELYVLQKKDKDKAQRELRFRRKKEEDKNPELKVQRLAKNKPKTLDSKRVWDDVDDDSLGMQVDVEQLKRRRIEEEEAAQNALLDQEIDAEEDEGNDDDDDDADSMLASDDDDDNEEDEETAAAKRAERERKREEKRRARRDDSAAPSTTSTNLDLTPSSLALKFPALFTDTPPPAPKILITTSLNSTLHHEADIFRTVFPNATYVPRSAHRYGHKYSLREISKFAANRDYTAVVLLKEDQKKLTGMSIVHLPAGPTFTFSITNFMEGKKLPGHGNPTNHYPELLLNNFKTPLGLLTAALFQRLFPPQPEVEGRQVLTVHNQRDYLFWRRHRYVFREKRETEKNITTAEGSEMKGVEGIRVGLQEIGPRFTAKLRRVDKGIGRAGSEGDDAQPWEWKARMEKDRKRFNL